MSLVISTNVRYALFDGISTMVSAFVVDEPDPITGTVSVSMWFKRSEDMCYTYLFPETQSVSDFLNATSLGRWLKAAVNGPLSASRVTTAHEPVYNHHEMVSATGWAAGPRMVDFSGRGKAAALAAAAVDAALLALPDEVVLRVT
jgi:hypothetical protein